MTEQADSELANLARIADLSFRNRTAMLYEGVIRDSHDLVDEYLKEGIASAGKYLRKAVDAVTAQFQTVEKLFEEIYIRPFENKPLPRTTEQWLRGAVQKTIEPEVARAQRVTGQVCSSFMKAAPDVYTAYITHLTDEGREMQRRLDDAITVLALKPSARANNVSMPMRSSGDRDTAQTPESNLLVLISHSSKDVELAQALIDLLRAGLDLQAHQIRCSSVDGYRLPVGVDTDDKLREEVNAAKVVVGLITPNSLASPYVMFELGARWGVKRFLAPLLAGVEPDKLGGPLRPLNALTCTEAQLHQFLGNVATELGSRRQPPEGYLRHLRAVVQRASLANSGPRTPSAAIGPGRPLSLALTIEGSPPSQVLKVAATKPVSISRLEYMLSDGTCIASDDLSLEGETINVPVGEPSLTKLFNIPRPDMAQWDHSGPVKLGLVLSSEGSTQQYVVPARLESVQIGSTMYRAVTGSKRF
jgi:hypothetical protein